jgi:hypothetical protein
MKYRTIQIYSRILIPLATARGSAPKAWLFLQATELKNDFLGKAESTS